MCSKVIRNLLQDQSISFRNPVFAYYFFDFTDVAKQSIEGMVRSLIFQLIAQLDEVPHHLLALYSEHVSSTVARRMPSLQEWCNILKLCLQSAECGHVLLDALDECGEGEMYLLNKTIETLIEETPTVIKWFLTCRPSPSRPIMGADGFAQSSMGTEVVDNDIQHYLSTRLKKDSRLASFGPTARDLIVSQITSGSSGR
jgi:hypothetical protein